MAYGGVAQTYCLWKLDGEPFKEGKAQYVHALHPITKTRKKVRWYTDKKHADLMPKGKDYGPFWKVFGYTSHEGTIIAIKERDLSKEEIAQYFSSKWRMGMFFGGIWYAPEGTELPLVKRIDKYFYPTWQEFRAAAQVHSKKIGVEDSCWFQDISK